MKKIRIISFVLLALIVLSGCQNQATDNIKDNKGADKRRIVNTITGEVFIPANPQRIADISGSSEELLLMKQNLVATANTDPYNTSEFPSYIEDQMKEVKIVGFSMMDTMDIEGILESNPDLIIMSRRQEKIYDQLKKVAPVVMIKDYANDWKNKMNELARLFKQEEQVQNWLEDYDNKAQDIAKKIIKAKGEQTYLTVLASGGQFYIFSNGGIGAIIYEDMKLAKPANLPDQKGISLPVVTMEGLSEIDADHIIVIATKGAKKDLERSSVWKSIRAVKEGNVSIFESTPYFGQGYNPIGRKLLLDIIAEKLSK
ncbi:ABC transporter substrate-binding protein [Orenia marismortui]|uniref:ABC transporter substrate-binding protein n=1 Tax=Orenia marismortui TaxID=46469 RepID=UPI00036FB4AB|nr:ABC transporter substrate-binding protein [Orenia marismortui]